MLVEWAKRTAACAAISIVSACLPPELTFDPTGGGGEGGAGGSCPQCGECEACSSGQCRPAAGVPCEGGFCDAEGRCATGEKVWLQRFGENDDQLVASLAVAPDDTIVLGGLMRGRVTFEQPRESTGGDDAFLAWLKGEDGTPVESELFGDVANQQINAVCIGGEEVHAAGSFTGAIPPLDEMSGETNAFLLSRTSVGFVSILDIGSEVATDRQYGLSVAHPDMGDLTWIGGSFEGGIELGLTLASTGEDAFLARFDDESRELRGADHIRGDGDESIQAMASVPAEEIVVAVGDFTADVTSGICPLSVSPTCGGGFFVYASNCSAVRAFCAGSSAAHARGVAVATDGTIWITGFFEGTLDVGMGAMTSAGEDVFVVKLDALGEPLFSAQFGGPGDDRGHAIAVDSSGSAIIAGRFTGAFSVGTFELDGGGEDDAFVFKLAAAGEPLWAHAFAGPGHQSANAVAVDSNESAVVAGELEGSATFTGENLMSDDGNDIFVIKLAR